MGLEISRIIPDAATVEDEKVPKKFGVFVTQSEKGKLDLKTPFLNAEPKRDFDLYT